MQYNKDVYYNLLLQSDNLKEMCYLNHDTLDICL